MNDKRPIKKKHSDWTLLDKAYDLIEDGCFDDLDNLFSYHDADEIEGEPDVDLNLLISKLLKI